MAHEEELANLLARIGLERGLGAEQVADEMGSMALPTFVDALAFRSALVAALERQLRAQVERQIDAIRQRIGTAGPPDAPISAPALPRSPASSPPPAPPTDGMTAEAPPAPSTVTGFASAPLTDPPDDATVYWTPDEASKQR